MISARCSAARAGKATDVGLVAPAVRGLGPLGRPPEVADVLARADGEAVDEPGRERLELAADGGRARLVVERKPLLDVAAHDQRPRLSREREHLEIAVAHPLADLEGLVEELDRFREIALGHQRAERLGEDDAAVLDRLGLALEESLRGREPALRDGVWRRGPRGPTRA